MSKNKIKSQENFQSVLNRNFIFFVLLFLLSTASTVWLFSASHIGFAIFSLFLNALFLALSLVEPLLFSYSNKQLVFVYLLPFRKSISYNSITNIVEYSFFQSLHDFPHYELHYKTMLKGKTIIKEFNIPRTRKSKFLTEKHLKSKIIK